METNMEAEKEAGFIGFLVSITQAWQSQPVYFLPGKSHNMIVIGSYVFSGLGSQKTLNI